MQDDQEKARQRAAEWLSSALAARGMRAELRERDPIEKNRVLASAILAHLIQIWGYDLGARLASDRALLGFDTEVRWVVSSMGTMPPHRMEFSTAEEAVEHAWNLLVRVRDDARKAMGEYLAP